MTKDIPAKPSRIREERLQRHWSQYDLAKSLGATRITVTRWENGISYPNVYFRRQLSKLFGKSETELGLFPEDVNRRKQVETQEQIQKSFALGEDAIGSQPALRPTEIFLPLKQYSQDDIFFYNMALPEPNEFFGRASEKRRLLTRIRNGQPSSIIGPRRIGKTWLMSYVCLVAQQQFGNHVRIAYLDASWPSCVTLHGFLSMIVKKLALAEPLDTSVQGYLKSIESGVIDLQRRNITPVVCIDKFESLCKLPDIHLGTLEKLRSLTQMGLGLVTTSRRSLTKVIQETFGGTEETSPFANVFLQIPLKPFTLEDAKRFIQIKGTQAHFTDEECAFVLKYGRQKGAELWLPQRLQLAGTILHTDKMASQQEGLHIYRPDDPAYWQDFEQQMDEGSEE